jgi:flagellar assembly factor FliW
MTTSTLIKDKKLYFEEGLPGFSHLRFYQLSQEEEGSPFYSLQSIEDEQVSFWLVNPFPFMKEYEFTLSEPAKAQLQIKEETPIGVLTILTIRSEGMVTANLKAPIVINQENGMAKQLILNEEQYDIRHPLFKIQAKAASE